MCFRSSLNACRSSSVAKYLFALRPLGDRVDDAADQLLDAALALRRADLAAEIFRDDDVGRLLRPGLRDLDVALLEHHLAAFVADHRRAQLPLDLVERIDAGFGEEARERQTRRRPAAAARALRRAASPASDERRHRSRSTAFNRLLAGTCGLVGSALFHLVRSDHSGVAPGSRRSPPAPEGDRRSCVGKYVAASEPEKPCCALDEKLGVLARSLCLARRTNMRSASSVCQACKHHILCLCF